MSGWRRGYEQALKDAAKAARREELGTYVESVDGRGIMRAGLRPKWDRGNEIAEAIIMLPVPPDPSETRESATA